MLLTDWQIIQLLLACPPSQHPCDYPLLCSQRNILHLSWKFLNVAGTDIVIIQLQCAWIFKEQT